jgi:hypothetical protein
MRALIPFALLFVVASASLLSGASCSGSSGEPFDASGGDLPKSCSDGDAITIPIDECSGCNTLAYALCVDSTYSQCQCYLPSGYTVVPNPGFDQG